MSTATEITRLQTARNKIRAKLVALGLATATAKLDTLATAVDGIANNGDTSGTIDGLSGTSFTIPAGYTSGGTVSLTGDIEAELAAI